MQPLHLGASTATLKEPRFALLTLEAVVLVAQALSLLLLLPYGRGEFLDEIEQAHEPIAEALIGNA